MRKTKIEMRSIDSTMFEHKHLQIVVDDAIQTDIQTHTNTYKQTNKHTYMHTRQYSVFTAYKNIRENKTISVR